MTFTKEWIEELKYDAMFHSNDEQIKQRIVDALDHIERLQARVQELETQQRWLSVDDPAIFELDRGFYLYEDRRGAHNIGLFTFEDRRLLGATRIYNMRLYPPHLRNIPNPPKDGE
jgi:hypothetical protein